MQRPTTPRPTSLDPADWPDEWVLYFHWKLTTAIAAETFMESIGAEYIDEDDE